MDTLALIKGLYLCVVGHMSFMPKVVPESSSPRLGSYKPCWRPLESVCRNSGPWNVCHQEAKWPQQTSLLPLGNSISLYLKDEVTPVGFVRVAARSKMFLSCMVTRE